MRYLTAALMVGGLWASNLVIAEKAMEMRNFVDTYQYAPVNSSPDANIAGTSALTPWLTDSSRNQYTIWTSLQEPVDVQWFGGGRYVAFHHRMWHSASTGYLKLHWTYNDGGSWNTYENINGTAGLYDAGGRYPDATLMDPALFDFPVASWPELAPGPAWGYMAAATVDPSGAYGIRSDNIGTHKCNSLMLPDGNVFMCGTDASDIIYVAVYDPANGLFLVDPTAALTGVNFSGIDYDYTNNIIYIFGMDPNTVELEYFTGTWDGTNLNINTTPTVVDLTVTPPYNVVWWDTWTLRDGTTPVCAVAAGDDPNANYPKVIYFTDGTNTVMLPTVNAPTDTLQRLVPQLNLIEQVDGSHLTVLWAQVTEWRTDQTYGWAMYDLYISYSADNGATWCNPINLTETPNEAECLPEAPQHNLGCELWFVWGREPSDETDIYWDAITNQDPPLHGLPCYLYLTSICYVDVSEGAAASGTFSYRMLGKNLILSGLPANVKANATVYDVVGRELKSAEGTGELRIDMSGLPTGTYLFKVDAGKFSETGKVVVTR